jgi:hypothetical protein
MLAALLAGSVAQAEDTPSPAAGVPPPVVVHPAPPPTVVQPPSNVAEPPPPEVNQPPASAAEPPPQPSAIKPPPPPVQPPPSAVQSVAPQDAEAILGQRVTDARGADIGRLVDVLVDANGQPQAAVIDFGGFMGVGNRKVAVHWSALRFTPADPKHKIALDMTPDQIKAAPEFRNPNKAAAVVTPADTNSSQP